MKKSVKITLIVLCFVLVGVIIFSSYMLYNVLHGYKVADDLYSDISLNYVDVNSASQSGSSSAESEPVSASDFPISVDFDELMNENADVVGWIYSEDTVINYPVVQTVDNDYYLHRLLNRSSNANGTIFIDCENYRDFSSKNTIMYGHHMNDGSMFASLTQYKSQEYYEAHPVMYLSTPTQNYRVELFSGFVTTDGSSAYMIEFSSDEVYQAFLNKMKSYSDFQSDVTVSSSDRIITFSTCTYDYDDARFVLFGKLVPVS